MTDRIRYRRARFTTWLPVEHTYAPSHYWIGEGGPGRWRIGLSAFALRMLGDLVEFQFGVSPGDAVAVGQTIGWIEGFKAVSDIYAVMAGAFDGANPALAQDVTLLDRKPHDEGWLYALFADRAPEAMDVHEYIGLLDATIDRMLEQER